MENNTTVLRLDIILNHENLELEADLQHGRLLDGDKARAEAQKFLDKMYKCLNKNTKGVGK